MSGAGVVEAEVFENERFLPFRGWGHDWPGHLLPTDRVGHWSLRGDRPSGAESMDFHRVAPSVPEVCTDALQTLLIKYHDPTLTSEPGSRGFGAQAYVVHVAGSAAAAPQSKIH